MKTFVPFCTPPPKIGLEIEFQIFILYHSLNYLRNLQYLWYIFIGKVQDEIFKLFRKDWNENLYRHKNT